MPQVTVYVRKDDLPKWKALDKKSEFIHNALNAHEPDAYFLSPKVAKENPELVKDFDNLAERIKPIKTQKQANHQTFFKKPKK